MKKKDNENKNKNTENIINNKKEKDSKSAENKEAKELVVKKEKGKKLGIGKILRQTSLTILLILIIIAGCIGLNIFVENANLESFDFTAEKVNSISEMSKQVAREIDQDVEIIIYKYV